MCVALNNYIVFYYVIAVCINKFVSCNQPLILQTSMFVDDYIPVVIILIKIEKVERPIFYWYNQKVDRVPTYKLLVI